MNIVINNAIAHYGRDVCADGIPRPPPYPPSLAPLPPPPSPQPGNPPPPPIAPLGAYVSLDCQDANLQEDVDDWRCSSQANAETRCAQEGYRLASIRSQDEQDAADAAIAAATVAVGDTHGAGTSLPDEGNPRTGDFHWLSAESQVTSTKPKKVVWTELLADGTTKLYDLARDAEDGTVIHQSFTNWKPSLQVDATLLSTIANGKGVRMFWNSGASQHYWDLRGDNQQGYALCRAPG